MLGWKHITAAAVAAGMLLMLLIVLFWRWCCGGRRGRKEDFVDVSRAGHQSLQDGIAKLHRVGLDPETRRKGNYYVFRRGVSLRPLFNWAHHPSLITDAVENGWSRFGFTSYISSPSTRSSLLGLCAAVGEHGKEMEPVISWEVCQGSADFMQKIRLNSGLKQANMNTTTTTTTSSSPSMAAASVIRTALPLPGPPLGNSPFPQAAYFEITIMFSGDDDPEAMAIGRVKEGERTKLIHENSGAKANSESIIHVTSHSSNKLEETKLGSKDDGRGEYVMLSVGLAAGGSLPLKLPGSYPGSIGLHSNGSVYLDGIKLVFESEKEVWGRGEKVIGVGFDPRQKKVFFTVDSELVHVVHCKSEEFGSPLYPTIGANREVEVLVNFGQSMFSYAPANAQRTPNPCFIGPLVNSPAGAAALGYEDSKELFSMGRIDSQWLNRSTTKNSLSNYGNGSTPLDFDEESEADLFEIILDSSGRSPHAVIL